MLIIVTIRYFVFLDIYIKRKVYFGLINFIIDFKLNTIKEKTSK